MQYFKKNGNSKHLITRRTKICDHLRMVTREMNVRILSIRENAGTGAWTVRRITDQT